MSPSSCAYGLADVLKLPFGFGRSKFLRELLGG